MKINALLIDLDGTVYEQGKLLPGIRESIDWLKEKKIPFKFCTNTTRKTIQEIQQDLYKIGLSVSLKNIISPIKTAIEYCRIKNYQSIEVVVPDEKILDSFSGFTITRQNPQAIVLGDLGVGFTHNLLTDLFKKILTGAQLIAMHKNRYWLTQRGLVLDLGPFVSALEYATGTEAVIVGKPNPHFFKIAINGWDIPTENIAMIGDDLIVDIQGAQNYGIKGVLVKTGKFRAEDLQTDKIQPDFVISSLADVMNIF